MLFLVYNQFFVDLITFSTVQAQNLPSSVIYNVIPFKGEKAMLQKPYFNAMDYGNNKMDTHFKLAHAYIPFQVLGEVFSPSEALCKGTLFPKLNMPYQYER